MKNRHLTNASIGVLLGISFISGCCCVNIGGCWPKAKYEKAVKLQAPLESGSTVLAKTSYGSITVKGDDVRDCNIIAKICVRAPSEEEAREIAEKVKIQLEKDGKTLTIKADKPDIKKIHRSIGISYQITVPKQTSIECRSSYGSVNLSDINGSVDAHTSYGSVCCKNIEGQIEFDTSYGSVNCGNIISDVLNVDSSYGSIDIEYSDKASSEIEANVKTSYGNIDFAGPTGFTGLVELATSYGSIETDLPITVIGKISKRKIKGTIGEGNGKLCLKTSYGSIKIK